MKNLVTFALIVPSLALSGLAPLAPAHAQRVTHKAEGCTLPEMTIALDAKSFDGVPGTQRPGDAAKLKANFSGALRQRFAGLCKIRRITPAAFRGINRIVLMNAEGDTDGHFSKVGMPRGSMEFEFLFDGPSRRLSKGLDNALECLARPVQSCFED